MDTLLIIAVVVVVGTLNVACFFVGAKVGQTVAKGKDIEVPTINPVEIHRQNLEKRHAEEEKNKIETILQNIDNYDGTEMGQKDVPM